MSAQLQQYDPSNMPRVKKSTTPVSKPDLGKTESSEQNSAAANISKKEAAKPKISENRLAKIGKKGGKTVKPSTRISKSGKYKSIRHLMETLLTKNKKLTFEKANETVLREYPDSAFNAIHFSWYKNKIVSHGEVKER